MKTTNAPSVNKIAKYYPDCDPDLMKYVIDSPNAAWNYVKLHKLYPPTLSDYTHRILRMVALKHITDSLAVEFFVSTKGPSYFQLPIRYPLPTFVQYDFLPNISLVDIPHHIAGKKARYECVRCI